MSRLVFIGLALFSHYLLKHASSRLPYHKGSHEMSNLQYRRAFYLQKSTLPMPRLLSSKAHGLKYFLKTIVTLSCWYSFESSCGALPDEYLFARVSVIFHVFFPSFGICQISHSSIRVKLFYSN